MGPATSQGALLKSTREAREISLEVVHEATKIPMDVLRAIEEGYTVRTLTPFYLKGFTKMYAEYLKINVRDIAGEVRKPPAPATVPAAPVVPEETFDLAGWLGGVFTHRRKQQLAVLAVLLFCFFILFKVITFFTHRTAPAASKAGLVKAVKKEKAPAGKSSIISEAAPVKKVQAGTPKTSAAVPPPKAAEPVPPKVQAKAAPSSAVIPRASAPTQQLEKEIMLTVRAKKDTWLRVEADGITVFQSGLSRGKSETWLATDKIEISGKNMDQLEFELNGKMIGALSRGDRKAKKIMITPDGLSVQP